ncbi:Probable RNA polymerase sigma factor fecI [Achromobacter spanius]|uniref:sigma-70 family RNA polymerase sigma factor n=1 Tax=Achromobacter spanius TaxID=217203 RepID=UPI000C2C5589|nr:sigma-70 family RNA polymerase sigma factor [Achromobacter spanius]AUA57404.1 RNA polymerase ECF-subfamily sigma-70 factor [Achromobacter spanius]CAB3629181.1 ECF RNA polymerase sigma factor SigE [Achromobacter spanius]SPT41152.1 Probable RNA polymerase sigma factor fecI [Achromobacter denitrificans]VEE54883.1 Probable RNA polymerase sigma factor fecI [Achromobacter spanius]
MPRSKPQDKGWIGCYAEMVRGWVRKVGNTHEAEDALQDAAVGLLKSDGGHILEPRAYLYRASMNSLAGNARREARLPTLPLHEISEDDHPRDVDSGAAVRAAQLAAAVEAALLQLPIKCRQAYIWHRLEGYSHQEVAARLGVSLNSVERYIMRAMRHLRDALHSYAPD